MSITDSYPKDSYPEDSYSSELRQRLLRFPLGPQGSVLLPLEQITEILKINLGDILPIPDLPGCLLGLCNWRGEMLWLMDFNSFVGYRSLLQQEPVPSSLIVMVVHINHQSLGIVVQQVHDIELHTMQQLQPASPGLFPPALQPLILGILPECGDAVLSIHALAQCPLWKRHQDGGV
jgi:chemotaxis signal transduction protein